MSEAPKRRRIFQISMRGLLILVAVFAVGLAFVARWHDRARRQRDAVAALLSNYSNDIWYEKKLSAQDPDQLEAAVPRWLQGLLDVDHFYNVVGVDLWEATDDEMQLLTNFPRLQWLDLSFKSECTASGLARLQSLRILRTLHLGDIPALDDRTLAWIGSLTELQHLSLECGGKVTDAGLAELTRLSDLKSLSVKCGLRTSDVGLASIGKLSTLERLQLDLDDDSNVRVVFVPGLAGLSSCSFILEGPIRGRALARLGDLKQLTSLTLVGEGALMDESLSRLGEIPGLRTLSIQTKDGGVSDIVLAHLAMATSLETLSLDCRAGTEKDSGWANLAALPKLQWLELRVGPAASDAGLAKLNSCPSLHRLALCLNDRVTDDGLKELGTCPSLRRLRLELNDHVTGDAFANLEELEYLELDFKARTPSAPLGPLRLPASIEDLVIHGPASVADDDLDGLANLTKLQRLDLFQCNQVTDVGLNHLKRLPRLKELGVYWCDQTTDAGVASLQASLPSCNINVARGGGSFGFMSRF